MDIGVLLRASRGPLARVPREAPALSIGGGPTWTYGDLDTRACRIANALLGLGARRGDRVAILLHNSLDYVAAYLAVVSLGCVAVRVNFRLSSEEFVHVLGDSGSTLLLLDHELIPQVEPILDQVSVRTTVLLTGSATPPSWAYPVAVVDEADPTPPHGPPPDRTDPACLLYTSGTTGRPKGALWSHDNTMWLAAVQAIEWGYSARTVAMTTGPLYHIGALEDLILPCLLVGGHAVITPSRNFQISAALDSVRRFGVTDALMFPFMLDELAELPEEAARLPSLVRVVTGGSAVSPRTARELARRLPDTQFLLGYGLTEGGALVCMPDTGIDPTTAHTSGRQMTGVEVQIRTSDGQEVSVGQEGEIWVRGPAVARAYWNNPQATASTFREGWCHTGDVGRVADGVLVITGRSKDMIRTGGENVFPAEIEAVLMDHPEVLDVAVIGLPDPRFQEGICAVIVPRHPQAPPPSHEIIDYVASRLARYKRPSSVFFVDTLPRNLSGKVQKFILQEQFTQGSAVG